MSMIVNHKTALYTAQQSKELDKLTGIDGFTLMKTAGQAVYKEMLSQWINLRPKGKLHIFCGAGNNAGDGYVIASCARADGIEVTVTAVKEPETLSGEALQAWHQFKAEGGTISHWSDTADLSDADVIVDALLGTGIKGEVSSQYASVIKKINQSGRPVLSVDIPSGLCADTGVVCGIAVQATLTVTVISLKKGLFTANGPQQCGKLLFADLFLPAALYEKVQPFAQLITPYYLCKWLKPRKENSHKGSFGSLLLIGGEQGMGGAVLMAAEAALACGAGRVIVLTRQMHVSAFIARCPEIMVYACENNDVTELITDNITAVVAGPGLGKTAWSKSVIKSLQSVNLPILFDADALNLLAENSDLCSLHDNHIFTPHPGEAARLLQTTTADIQQNRFDALARLQKRWRGCIVLKGSGSLIADDKAVMLCDKGNAGLSIPGSGDILSGIAGSLLAQGYDTFQAGCLGVWLHASAGDQAIKNLPGKSGLKATELIPHVRYQLNQLYN